MGTPFDRKSSYTDAIRTPGKSLPKVDSSDSIKAMNSILKDKLANLERAVPNTGGPMKPVQIFKAYHPSMSYAESSVNDRSSPMRLNESVTQSRIESKRISVRNYT
jgi:hypothetical protein